MLGNAIPYWWMNETLGIIALCLLFTSIIFAVLAFMRKGETRKRFVWVSLLCLFATLSAGGANYALLFYVQLPALFPQPDLTNGPGTLTHIGDPVPEFSFTTLDGTEIHSSDLHGKTVLLNFFATWCGPCLKELPHLQDIWTEFGKNPYFAMFVMGREESDKTIAEFNSDERFTFPMASDSDRSVYGLFASELIPRTYVISADGKILYQTHGFYESEIAKIRQVLKDSLSAK
jgi:peroxiredoxin